MRRWMPLLMLLLLLSGNAGGEILLTNDTEAMLPDGVHLITMPAGMISQIPDPEESDLKGIFIRKPDLEMLVFAYNAGGTSVEALAEALREAGRETQIREISGERFLVYQDRDEADGAACVGYSYMYQGWMIEIAFFYGSQEAADLTAKIMESFHE
ncbi:MAG: hypothetical protein J5898_09735 [Lachnospiraceae bacterium]|nr:hypothetical protein [Lachnospiraceae bacterium]